MLRIVPAMLAACLLLACGDPGQGTSGGNRDGGRIAADDTSGAEAMMPADSLSVRVGAFLLRYVEALEERDTAALRGMLVSDGRFVWLEDGAIRYRSPDQVLRGLDAFPTEAPVRTVLGEVEAVSMPGSAVHAWTPFTTTVGRGEDALSFSGMLSFALEARGGGWRIVGGHTSTTGDGG